MMSQEGVREDAGSEIEDESELFAGLTESAAIVIAQAGSEEDGTEDKPLLSLRMSDLVAEFVDLRSDHGELALSGSALEGAKAIRQDLVQAFKILNAAILKADVAALTAPTVG
jgi:hypothetical protein